MGRVLQEVGRELSHIQVGVVGVAVLGGGLWGQGSPMGE